MSDLFEHARQERLKREAPLAARMRPRTLDEYVGQDHIVGEGKLLRRAILADKLYSSIILWGPPGTGKTTLAQIIANHTQSHFETISAVLAGVAELRRVIHEAQERNRLHQRRTTLFVDEVHRWNKAQQDALLPHIENGTIVFVGATTENPYFEVIGALVSRSRIFQLFPLTQEQTGRILDMALTDVERGYGARPVVLEPDAHQHLVDVAGGDARNALNALELAVESTPPGRDGAINPALLFAALALALALSPFRRLRGVAAVVLVAITLVALSTGLHERAIAPALVAAQMGVLLVLRQRAASRERRLLSA